MACPVHKGTRKSFVWSRMNKLSMFFFLKSDYFQLVFHYWCYTVTMGLNFQKCLLLNGLSVEITTTFPDSVNKPISNYSKDVSAHYVDLLQKYLDAHYWQNMFFEFKTFVLGSSIDINLIQTFEDQFNSSSIYYVGHTLQGWRKLRE